MLLLCLLLQTVLRRAAYFSTIHYHTKFYDSPWLQFEKLVRLSRYAEVNKLKSARFEWFHWPPAA